MFISMLQIIKDMFLFTGYLSSKTSFPEALSAEDEAKYIALYEKGDMEARQELIVHNLRLVAHIAKKYGQGNEIEDLISIGSIGLIKAVNTFNRGKGTALAAYAANCIENEIRMSIRTKKKSANDVSISNPVIADMDGNEISIGELVGTDADEVFNRVSENLEASRLRELLGEVLTKQERTVIELRYGLLGGCPMPQREVAAIMGISRSYVSRIETKAIKKLQKHTMDF